MTSLETDWDGAYLDGRTAARRRVRIRIMRLGLQIDGESGESLWWPYEEIRQTQGFYSGEQVRLERGGDFSEVLLIGNTSFLTHLHRMIPEAAGRFHNPASRMTRARIIVLAAAGSLTVVALLYLWGIPSLAAIVASRVPVTWEEHLGNSVVQILAPEELRCKDPRHTRVINDLVKMLITSQKDSPYKFRVFVLNSPMINAFAAPGGTIIVMRGLLEQTKNPEELAGVLAHEMQHIIRRHTTRLLIQQASIGLLLGAMTGNTDKATSYGLETARAFGLMRYSRGIEEEADIEGMQMLLDAGIDPEGMVTFFGTLKEKGAKLPSFLKYLSTHPSADDRIERLRSLAARNRRDWVPLLKGYDWSDIKKICPKADHPQPTQREPRKRDE